MTRNKLITRIVILKFQPFKKVKDSLIKASAKCISFGIDGDSDDWLTQNDILSLSPPINNINYNVPYKKYLKNPFRIFSRTNEADFAHFFV